MGDFGFKRQRVEFVGDVQENDDFETPRVDRAAHVFCVQKCKSVMTDSTELPQVRRREFFQVCRGVRSQRALMRSLISQQERCFLSLDVKMIVQFLTLEVLCPRAQWIMRRYSLNSESVLGESLQHYCIKCDVPFTNRTGSTKNVNFEVTNTKRSILCIKAAATAG